MTLQTWADNTNPLFVLTASRVKAVLLYHAADFGYQMPKAMHPEFGKIVKAACDKAGREIMPKEIFALFEEEYLHVHKPYNLKAIKFMKKMMWKNETVVHFEGNLRFEHTDHMISGVGNGPIDAFFNALKTVGNYKL